MFFSTKFTPIPHQWKTDNYILTEFWSNEKDIIFYFKIDSRSSVYKGSDIKNRFLLKFIFPLYPEGDRGEFFEKN